MYQLSPFQELFRRLVPYFHHRDIKARISRARNYFWTYKHTPYVLNSIANLFSSSPDSSPIESERAPFICPTPQLIMNRSVNSTNNTTHSSSPSFHMCFSPSNGNTSTSNSSNSSNINYNQHDRFASNRITCGTKAVPVNSSLRDENASRLACIFLLLFYN